MRNRRRLFVIPVAALVAIWPLVLHGSSCGDDFGFHLINWLAVHSQWRQGILYPHWDFTAAWNSGAPRFIFYPPLSWVAGALAGFVLPWTIVPTVFIWAALTACGFTMYRLAREWAGAGAATISACFYMVHPYMMFTYYERSAFAELLAAAWIPLIILAVLRRRISVAGIAIPVALLWLTDAPAAVMGCYLLAVLAAARVVWTYAVSQSARSTLREAGRVALGCGIGLAAAGFYLVPAILEQRWVHIIMPEIPGVRVQDNFLFGQFGGPDHRAILRSASLASVTLLGLIAFFGLAAIFVRDRRAPEAERGYLRFLIAAMLAASALVGFFLTSPSFVLWRLVPELKNLQFPWRLDALLGALAAALLALALARFRMRPGAQIGVALAIPLLLTMGGNSWYRQYCNPGYSASGVVAAFESGNPHDSTEEYPPATSDSLAVGHANPAAWIAAAPGDPPPPNAPADYSTDLAGRLRFHVESPAPAFLVVNVRDYPAWRITVNGTPSGHRPHRRDGLIVTPIPHGASTIQVRWTLTSDHIFGWALTALGFLALLFVWRTERAGRTEDAMREGNARREYDPVA